MANEEKLDKELSGLSKVIDKVCDKHSLNAQTNYEEKKNAPSKTSKILEQNYLTAEDLMNIIPKLSYGKALQYIKDTRLEMESKGLFVPDGKTLVALTKLIRKKFGF